jgi:membrane associated rhomboid family serine protease
MLYDRPYMRDDPLNQRTSPLTWLLCGLTAGFVIQVALGSWFGAEGAFVGQLAVTPEALRAGHVWTLATHALVHDPFVSLPSSLLNTFCSLLALYFLGRELLPVLGSRRFWWLSAGALVAGGLCWAAVNWRHGGALFGATAIVDALLVVYACFFPNQELTFLLLFVLPVRLKPKHLAMGVALFDLAGFAFFEALGRPSPLGGQHSAHLAGMAVGGLYYRFIHEADWKLLSRKVSVQPVSWPKQPARAAAAAPGLVVAATNRDGLRAEVDRILDKINSHGFGALTAEEKRVLDEARDLLSRR